MRRYSDLVSIGARSVGNLTSNVSSDANDSSLIRLDSNENPFGPSPRAIETMRIAAASAHAYPDDHCIELRRKLANRHQVAVDQVLVTPGSSGMLSLLCQTLLGPGLNAVTSERSFILYSMVARAAGGRLIEAPMRGDAFSVDGILRAINSDTRLVLVANPNNPTGTMIDDGGVQEILRRVPDHVVVVLDEAYYEFTASFARMRNAAYSNSLGHVRDSANVVVLRTFSKVHGLAGMRIGYGMGPADLLRYCAGMANTYSVGSLAQAAAMAAMDDEEHIRRTVINNSEQASVLESALREFGFRAVPTSANFVYCDLGREAAEFAGRMREQGVSVRPLGTWGAPNCIRVTIGTPEQNRKFLEAAAAIASTQ